MFKLAIFDLDGTLLNSLDDLAAACNFALSKAGFPTYEAEAYKQFIGRGPVNLVKDALPELNRDDATVQKTLDDFLNYYHTHSSDLTKPYDGILDMLHAVREAGVDIAVLSNKPHEQTCMLCEQYFSGLVSKAVGFKRGVEPKPNPEPGFELIRSFGVLPEDTVYIGDSGVDMLTGKALGAYTVGVSWGYRTKDELQSNGADIIIDKACELIKIIVDK